MAILLGAIMQAETAVASAVFLSIRNSRAQKDALTEAAQVALTGRELERIPVTFERSLHAGRSSCILVG
jgi:hypothetical protein